MSELIKVSFSGLWMFILIPAAIISTSGAGLNFGGEFLMMIGGTFLLQEGLKGIELDIE